MDTGGTSTIRRWVLLTLALALTTIGIVVPTAPAGAELAPANPADQTNRDLIPQCGNLRITMVLDESGSLDAAALNNVRTAVRTFAYELRGTGSSMRVVDFNSIGRDVTFDSNGSAAGGSALQGFVSIDTLIGSATSATDSSTVSPLNGYLNQNATAAVTGANGGYGATVNSTNWESALWRAGQTVVVGQPAVGDLVVFMTDGQPNSTGQATRVPDNASQSRSVAWSAAVDEIANLQQTAHVIGVGVGAGGSSAGDFGAIASLVERWGSSTTGGAVADMVQVYLAGNISASTLTSANPDGNRTIYNGGTNSYWNYGVQGTAEPATGTLDVTKVDAINAGSDFGALQGALEGIARSLCSRTLTVIKTPQLNPAVNGGVGPLPADWGFTFTLTRDGTTVPTANNQATPAQPSVNWAGLAPGNYTLQENATSAPWAQGTLSCTFPPGTTNAHLTNPERYTFTMPANALNFVVDCGMTNIYTPPAPTLSVTKSPSPTAFDESTGAVTYSVRIVNPNPFEITITDVVDRISLAAGLTPFADLVLGSTTTPSVPNDPPGSTIGAEGQSVPVIVDGATIGSITSNKCGAADTIGKVLAASNETTSDETTCVFTITYVDRTVGEQIFDRVTVSGRDVYNRPLTAGADASVNVLTQPPSVIVDKQNIGTTIPVAGGVVSYRVRVSNPADDTEPIRVTSFTDTLTGVVNAGLDITQVGSSVTATTCGNLLFTNASEQFWTENAKNTLGDTPATTPTGWLQPGQYIECTFSVNIDGPLPNGAALFNTVVVNVTDDDPTPQPASGQATTTARNVDDPAIRVWKFDGTDGNARITQPSSVIPYTIYVDNISGTGVHDDNGTPDNPADDFTTYTGGNDVLITQIKDEVWLNGEPRGTLVFTRDESDPEGYTLTNTLGGGVTVTTQPGDYPGTFAPDCAEVVGAAAGTWIVPATSVPDDAYLPVVPAGARAACTIWLSLPGVALDTYTDTATVDGVDELDNPVRSSNDASTPVDDALPAIKIVKTASQTQIAEPGGLVTFTFTVTNISNPGDPLTVTSLIDSALGDLFDAANSTAIDNTCTTFDNHVLTPAAPGATPIPDGQDFADGQSFTCTAKFPVEGNADKNPEAPDHWNQVDVIAVDDEGKNATALDTAEVEIVNDVPAIEIVKTALTTEVFAPGANVTFEFTITNTSDSATDPLTITDLDDDIFGNLLSAAGADDIDPAVLANGCATAISTPDPLNPLELAYADGDLDQGESITCQVEFSLTGAGGFQHKNTVTVTAVDDEGTPASDDDTATVDVIGVPVTLTKSWGASPATADVVDLTISGDGVVPGPATSGVNSNDGVPGNDTAATAIGIPGELVTLAETFATGKAGDYDTTLACWTGTTKPTAIDDQAWLDITDDSITVPEVAVTCEFTNQYIPPNVSVSKAVEPGDGPTQVPGTNRYEIVYTITVTNSSTTSGTFELGDDLDLGFGDDWTIDGTITSDPAGVGINSEWDGTGPLTNGIQQIGANETVKIFVPVEVTLPGATAVTGECGGEGGRDRSVINSVSLIGTQNPPPPAVCTELGNPEIEVAKEVVSATFGSGVWTIVYDITVENTGDGPGEYGIDDELNYGAGVVVQTVAKKVQSVTGQTDPAGPIDADLTAGFDGQGENINLVDGVEIVEGATHVYRITVTATIPSPTVGAGACVPGGGQAGGFLNTATVTLNGVPQPPVSDCEPFNTLTLVKHLSNDDGGEATYADFVLTATPSDGTEPVVEGTQQKTGAVPIGSYDLAEPTVAGYTADGWTCAIGQTPVTVASPTSTTGTITIALVNGNGVDVLCEIGNDDEPVDLELTKSDGLAADAAVMPGQTFPYTITVTNVGDRDMDNETVTVVDVLPAQFQWETWPTNAPPTFPVCVPSGQILTCNVDPALLTANGGSTTINTQVSVRPGTAPGVYTNTAYVSTEDDPVCLPGGDCTPPPCPAPTAQAGSNVGCDDTPVRSYDVGIVKSASGVPGGTLSNGEQFTYTLKVTNHGTGTATNVVVTDAVPARLHINSISAPGWTDGTIGNAVKLSRASLAPAASVDIVLTVTLLPAAVPPPVDIQDGQPAPPIPDLAIESILNEACVDADFDTVPGNDCSTAAIPVDDIVAVVYVRCVNDAPLLGYAVETTPSLAGKPITLTWRPNNPTAQTSPQQVLIENLQSGAADELTWPGAVFTSGRVSIDWPGWRPIQESDYVNGSLSHHPAENVHNGMILDSNEPDYAWRDLTTVTLSVNPTITFTAEYPDTTPECIPQRSAALDIQKTASVSSIDAGQSFSYTINVTNVSLDGAAEPVILTDQIPAQIRVDSIVTSTTAFPRWNGCLITGKDSEGYGGQLRCDLFGALPVTASAPQVQLNVTARPTASGAVTNTAVVSWQLADEPDSPVQFVDDAATITVNAVIVQPPTPTVPTLPPTGSSSTQPLIQLALLALLGGAAIVLVTRRRKEPVSG